MGCYYKCTMKEAGRIVSWTASIDTLRMAAPGQYEAEINGRGTYFHVIAGQHRYGGFLCIPNHSIGCELAAFSVSSDYNLLVNSMRLQPGLSGHARKC